MKNLIIKLSLIAIIVVACNTASAVYSDGPGVVLLIHCDATNQGYWLTTPDDNSSGRAANEPILDMAFTSVTIDTDTEPTLMPGSPKGGSYFSFDGVDDNISVLPGMPAYQNEIVCDFSFRANALPASDYSALIQTKTWRSFTYPIGADVGVLFLIDSTWCVSTVPLALGEWHDVHFEAIGGNATLTINGTDTTVAATIATNDVPIMIGSDAWGADFRFFDGDIDEVRISAVPEPLTFGLIGLLGLLAIRK